MLGQSLQAEHKCCHRSRQPNAATAGLPLEPELEVAAGGCSLHRPMPTGESWQA